MAKEFELFTNHITLKYVNTQNKLNNRHAQWVSFLQGYTFVLKHKLGRHNQVVDALIQRNDILKTMENQVIEFVALKDIYVSDNDFWEIVEQLKNPVARNMHLTRVNILCKMATSSKENNYAFQLVL